MRVEERSGKETLLDHQNEAGRLPDEIMVEAQKDLEKEKEKKLIEFLTRLVVKATLKEFYEQKY